MERRGVCSRRRFSDRAGLTERVADAAAVALGCHPSELWSEWFDEAAS
jgi:hypothetical protein